MDNRAVQELIDDVCEGLANLREPIKVLLSDARTLAPDLANLVGALLYFADQRGFAVVSLLRGGLLWDAEILMRPVMAATLRAVPANFNVQIRVTVIARLAYHAIHARQVSRLPKPGTRVVTS